MAKLLEEELTVLPVEDTPAIRHRPIGRPHSILDDSDFSKTYRPTFGSARDRSKRHLFLHPMIGVAKSDAIAARFRQSMGLHCKLGQRTYHALAAAAQRTLVPFVVAAAKGAATPSLRAPSWLSAQVVQLLHKSLVCS